MNRKLLILDVVLAAVAVYAGFQFRGQWLAAKAREAAILNRKLTPPPPPQFAPLATAPPVLSAGYAEIAQKLLFDRSRNSTVVVEVPPPPPPKPMPPLPVYHGMMNIGDGPSRHPQHKRRLPADGNPSGRDDRPIQAGRCQYSRHRSRMGRQGHPQDGGRNTRPRRRGRWLADANGPAPAAPPPRCCPSSRRHSARAMIPAGAIRFVSRTTARPTIP